MPLLVGYEPGGLDPAIVAALDKIIAPLQAWVGKQEGINADERLNELTTGLARLSIVPTGVILPYGGTTAPSGYLLCDGTAVSRETYGALFAAIGTAYGSGNGTSTFNVPDYRQAYFFCQAASGTGSTLGATIGTIDHVHTGPSHTHSVSGSTASESSHTHSFSGTTSQGDTSDVAVIAAGEAYSRNDHVHTFSGTTGGGSSHSHGVGTLATAAGGTGNTGSANPRAVVSQAIIKT